MRCTRGCAARRNRARSSAPSSRLSHSTAPLARAARTASCRIGACTASKLRESRTARCTGTRGQAHPSVRWRGTAVQRGPEQPPAEHLLEGKTIHRGGPHYMSARARDDGQGGAVADRANLVQRDYEARAAALDAKPHVQAWNNGSRDAVSSVLRSFGTVRSLVVGAYAEASDDLHQLFDCVVESASKQHWRRIGARSAKEARSYFATTLRPAAAGVGRALCARVRAAPHPTRGVRGGPAATAGQASRDGRWRLASAVGGRVCGARAARRRRVGGRPARPSVSTGREGRSALN